MIWWREELSNVEGQSTSYIILDPVWLDKMSKYDTSIRYQPLFKSTQLTWMDKIVQDWMELKSIADDFLNKFFYGIE